MIHIYVKINNENSIDFYYSLENIRYVKVITDKYNLKTLMVDDSIIYENVLDIIVEEL